MAAEREKFFISLFHNRFSAWSILTVSLILTITAYFVSKKIVDDKRDQQFEFRSAEIQKAIVDRMGTYEQALWGGVGLFHSSKNSIVKRDVFAKYVETLKINKNWPGIQGIGYSIPVKAADRIKHEQTIEEEGFTGFKIRPSGNRDNYSSIIYLEPFDWRNKRAHGYDMWSNEMRRNAMTRARDEGIAATSGIITLVQETSLNVQKGFLTYLPVYSSGTIPKTVEQRRREFSGWVYSPFRAGDLMKGVTGSKDKQIDFQIFDGKEMNLDSLLYTTLEDNETNITNNLEPKITTIKLQGRPWTIKFSVPDSAYQSYSEKLPQFIAICGAIIDILLFYVIFSLHYISKHTEELAQKSTTELRNKIKELEEAKS